MGSRPRFDKGELQCLYVGVSNDHPAALSGAWKIELSSGREIVLDEIRQSRTYAGLLGGLMADIDLNIDNALAQARDAFPQEEAPPVILTE